MKGREAKIGLIVFLSIILLIGLLWFLMDEKRASLAEGYINQGEELEKDGSYKEAYLDYKKAEIATPRSFAPFYRQAIVLKKINQTERAIKAFEKSISFAQQEMAPTFALAKTYFEEKNYFEAERYFQDCLAFEPDNSEVLFWIGRSQMNQNHLEEAGESFKTALDLFPSSQYHLYLGLVLAFEDLSLAQKELEQYYQSQNLSFSDFQEKSVQGVESEEEQNLRKAFERMINTESEATKKLILGQLLNQVGESGLAIQKLAELTKDYPKMRDGWVFLGYGYILENQPDQALEALEKAKKLDPAHPLTFQLISRAQEAQGNHSAAREALINARMLEGQE